MEVNLTPYQGDKRRFGKQAFIWYFLNGLIDNTLFKQVRALSIFRYFIRVVLLVTFLKILLVRLVPYME